MPSIPSVSREYLYLPGIRAFDAASPDTAADPTTLPVQVCFLPYNAVPEDADWIDAEWANATTARILIGPDGTVTPAVGRHRVWLRVTGAVEQPERVVGDLQVTAP
ncbi:MAG TPA: hypothetical protein VFJ19_09255 [Nocardioidaceae bacterium]|nr:hypothetical protein [Nocardioidaceae bacterium]